jgi:hypothetical protein
MNKIYFKELAKKIEVDVPYQVDQKIMSSIPFKKEESFLKIGFSFALAASLAFITYMNFGVNNIGQQKQKFAISEMMENKEMYENMDLLGQIEDIDLSEEDWKILLDEDETDV